MIYDFATMPDRRGKDSIAVDLQENDFWTLPKGTTRPEFDKIPMWIADMKTEYFVWIMKIWRKR